jgi:hypothetical protein
MTTLISVDDIEWQEHPVEAGAKTNPMAEFPDHEVRFRLNRVAEKGLTKHSHSNGHVFFTLKGRGKM